MEEELPPSKSQNESEDLDSFYTDYPGESDHQTEDPDNDYLNLNAQHSGAEAEVNFVDTQPISEHFCHLCKQPFKSRNKLFHHLKDVCWKREAPTPTAHSSVEIEENAAELKPKIIKSITPPSPRQGLDTTFRGF